ncbi:PQQ-binding-like beta-propeller repeat protein [Actinomadura oligospora]|uniref:outer membrane protein assembly factor BamB family protein n=1 Tax=Actinomadura oligospora TaxID=111804 RepID=UPI0004B81364|nr:PQQ-binding-like beta-propeller repeat protein [Actinomadura oligospora]
MPEPTRPSPSATSPRPPEEQRRSRLLPLRRTRLIALALLTALVTPTAAHHLQTRPQHGTRGPFGPYPGPIAAQAPLGSARPLTAVLGRVTIHDGLGLQGGVSRFNAINIRTGRVFWEDRRDDDRILDWNLDHAAGTVFILWKSGRVESVNVRSGKVRWHKRLPGDIITNDPGTGLVSIANVEGGNGGLVALDSRTGRERWRHIPDQTSGCAVADSEENKPPLHVAGNLVVTRHCTGGASLTAYDAAGRQRWRLGVDLGAEERFTYLEVMRLDDRTVVVDEPAKDGYEPTRLLAE